MTGSTKLLAAIAPLLLLSACSKQPPPPLSGAQLLEKHAAALGGKERLAAVHSRHIESALVLADGKPIGAFSTYSKAGNRLLTTMRVPSAETAVVYDGANGYTKDAKGIVPLTAKGAEHARITGHFDVVEACRAAADSCTPAAKGIRNVANRPCYLVSLKWKENGPLDAYLDAADFRLVRTVSSVDTPTERLEVITNFRDFQQRDGFSWPQTQSVTGKYGEYLLQVRTYEINPALRDELFDASPSNPALLAQAGR